jgi:hypothetical protein
MPKINVELPHNLGRKEAKRRVQSMLNNLKNEHSDKISGMNEQWEGDRGSFSFTAMGFKASGTIEITDSRVNIHGELPIAATFFKGKIEDMIEEKGKEVLR